MAIRFLHTNDMHGTLDDATQDRIRELRSKADFYFDTGDCIKTGNLGIPLRREPVWERLNSLDCSASVLGNRESHILSGAFEKKIDGAAHHILVANMFRRDGSRVMDEHMIVDHDGLKIAIFGVMVPMVTRRMKTQAASAFIWEQPIATATEVANRLRTQCDLVIALTHIGHRSDVELAEKCTAIDIIFGGHSHTVLETPQKVRNTYICQGGSHNRYVGQYSWSKGELSGGLIGLK